MQCIQRRYTHTHWSSEDNKQNSTIIPTGVLIRRKHYEGGVGWEGNTSRVNDRFSLQRVHIWYTRTSRLSQNTGKALSRSPHNTIIKQKEGVYALDGKIRDIECNQTVKACSIHTNGIYMHTNRVRPANKNPWIPEPNTHTPIHVNRITINVIRGNVNHCPLY